MTKDDIKKELVQLGELYNYNYVKIVRVVRERWNVDIVDAKELFAYSRKQKPLRYSNIEFDRLLTKISKYEKEK